MVRNEKSLYFITLVSIVIPFLINATNKNTCDSYLDYLIINFNGNCHRNPDVQLSVPEIIQKYTDSLQIFNVTTEDGYILSMFRIFRENAKGVVLMQPPMSADSIAWLSDGEESIAFLLWKNGYDVWLSNHRGSTYSLNHLKFSKDEEQFWNYGFHEIALYDLESQFEIIKNETGKKLTYFGYSISGTEALIYSSLKPQRVQDFVENFILVAPLTTLTHFSSPFQYILQYMQPSQDHKSGEFPTFETMRWIMDCLTISPLINTLASSIVMGWTPTEMDPSLYPFVYARHGRAITNHMLYHYGQLLTNKTHFNMYDYGSEKNVQIYGSESPPEYPLHKIQTPVYLIGGDKDIISTPEDLKSLNETALPNVKDIFFMPNHNHIDFMFSKHRKENTFQTVVNILNIIYT